MIDLSRYAACEIQRVDGGSTVRHVRLHDEPMHSNNVLVWLVESGFVKKVRETHPDADTDWRYEGWGTTYCAVPWERSVPR